ncbi:MAG: 5'-3' exonuclease H3TH domain-containing protein [bacterium]|nr:5'-3' exonuclease H3TH domain-containing protein [bacterium]
MGMNDQKFVIIDGHSVARRAYHALPPFTTKNGDLVNAVYGFSSVLLKIIKEQKPDFMAVAFDLPGATFRHEAFPGYKATRKKTPDEFSRQLPLIKEVLQAMGIKTFEKSGWEADDIIGAIANSAIVANSAIINEDKKVKVLIVSSDTDLLQLINGQTQVLLLQKGISQSVCFDEAMVREKYSGLGPVQLLDFKSLRGDPTDNIPGVSGIGEKTAIKLISEFGTLDEIYAAAEKSSSGIPDSLRQRLINQREQAFLSRKLATITKDAQVGFNLKECSFGDYDKQPVINVFESLHFPSLILRLQGIN